MQKAKRKMKNNVIATLLVLASTLSTQQAFSQNLPDGEKIIKCLGQEVMSSDVLDMIIVFDMKDDVVPDVKAGGGLTFYSPGGKVQRIGFQNNKDYGIYAGELPFGLSFEDTGKDILSKYPGANVNEDYQSFYIDNLTVSVKFSNTKQKKIEFIQVF
ncbi:MAG: hypothetical protein RBS55_00615 [Bacteroidales bacterium]|jgi:hypothetical protein|nr:hypothetical protein [Bacteroidales bacterium]